MTNEDQQRWNERYRSTPVEFSDAELPAVFGGLIELLPSSGSAIEIACGTGEASVWLASAGLHVTGYDVSTVAIDRARDRALHGAVASRCTFVVADMDDGLPAGDPVDVVLCHMFRDAALDTSIIERLKVGGVVAVSALSEVGARSGRFRVASGELSEAFSSLELLDHAEESGVAWVIARK